MTTSSRRSRVFAATGVLALAGSLITGFTPTASAASTSMVVSEVYGGGGNSGASFRSDFVELHNLGDAPVDLSGWSLKYYSAKGTSAQITPLRGTVAPGTNYLVKQADGANTSAAPLPSPDATGTVPMSAKGGRVELVDASGTTVDLLGWGGASQSEGSPAEYTDNTTSIARKQACVDTDDNAADFAAGAPTPQNAAAGEQDCVPGDPGDPEGKEATIPQIQGAAHRSPLEGTQVVGVTGVVTAVSKNGFWMQSQTPDDDPATSEGLFVFTRSAPTAVPGDLVEVAGTVGEYRPGGSGGTMNLSTTQITSPTVNTKSTGNELPAPVLIGTDRVAPQQTVHSDDPGNVEVDGTPFDPSVNALDFYESMEGMRVGLQDARAAGPSNSYGETPVVPGQDVDATETARGGVAYGGYDRPNAMRVQLDDELAPGSVGTADVGDVYAGATTGVLDYSFANFKLFVTDAGTLKSAGLEREVTATPAANELAVATFNVENLAPSDPQSKFDRLAAQVTTNLKSPDILALEEIQDDNGAVNDGTVDSTQTVNKLVAAIKAAGGPAYEARWVNPASGKDGGQPGGNIRSVFLYRTDRGVAFVDKPGATATSATEVIDTGRKTTLSQSPGRIDPTNPAWDDSRKPLVGQFTWKGRSVFVVANHFNSKGGDDPLFGRFQQPVRSSEQQRHQQARVVRGFVDKLLAADAKANVVVLGDLNDFEFSETADILVGSGDTALTDLPRTLPANERYTYVYQGNSQVLDHIMVSPNLARTKANTSLSYDIVHTNAEFHDQDSDHDPQVVRFPVQVTR